MYTTTVEVKISGPGMYIGTEVTIIKNYLQSLGFVVDEINDYPEYNNIENVDMENHIKKTKIKLIVDHLPWGG